MDMSDTVPIRDYRGNEVGMMLVEAQPCSDDGVVLTEDFVEDPKELRGRKLKFRITIAKLMGLPRKFSDVRPCPSSAVFLLP